MGIWSAGPYYLSILVSGKPADDPKMVEALNYFKHIWPGYVRYEEMIHELKRLPDGKWFKKFDKELVWNRNQWFRESCGLLEQANWTITPGFLWFVSRVTRQPLMSEGMESLLRFCARLQRKGENKKVSLDNLLQESLDKATKTFPNVAQERRKTYCEPLASAQIPISRSLTNH